LLFLLFSHLAADRSMELSPISRVGTISSMSSASVLQLFYPVYWIAAPFHSFAPTEVVECSQISFLLAVTSCLIYCLMFHIFDSEWINCTVHSLDENLLSSELKCVCVCVSVVQIFKLEVHSETAYPTQWTYIATLSTNSIGLDWAVFYVPSNTV